MSGLHWQYGFDVPVDTVEVWNIGHILQPPMPVGTSNEDAVRYWECWLNRGAHVARDRRERLALAGDVARAGAGQPDDVGLLG